MRELVKSFSMLMIFAIMAIFVFRPVENNKETLENFVGYYSNKTQSLESGSNSNLYTIEKEYILEDEEEVEGVPLEDKEKGIYEIPKVERYIVLQGETLSTIAEKNNISLEILKANNPGIKDEIKEGQVINIIKSNGVFYRVKKGDTITRIVSTYGIDEAQFRRYNNLTSDILQIGQELFILNPTEDALKRIMQDNGQSEGYKTFAMPVKWSGITSPFGSRFHPVLKRYIVHQGVDLKARYVPLAAAKDGVVVFAGYMSGYGKIIRINHGNGYETRSAHLDEIYVKKGERVKEGQIIGKTGMSGRVTGPHLHFEVRKDGKANNPMNYLVK